MAVTVLKYEENKRVLDLTNKQLQFKAEIAEDLSQQTILLKKSVGEYEQIVANKNLQVDELKKSLKKEARRKRWTQLGWGSTTVVLGGIIVLLAIK